MRKGLCKIDGTVSFQSARYPLNYLSLDLNEKDEEESSEESKSELELSKVDKRSCEAWNACFTISKGEKGTIIASAENQKIRLAMVEDGDLLKVLPE